MNMYQARYNNAKRIKNKINELISQGNKVLDEQGNNVSSIVEDDDSIVYTIDGHDNARYILFINDVELDNGIYTPIKEFNKQFLGWTWYKPSDVNKLIV